MKLKGFFFCLIVIVHTTYGYSKDAQTDVKEKIFQNNGHSFILTYLSQDQKYVSLESNLIETIGDIVNNYEELYDVHLPATIKVFIDAKTSFPSAYASTYNNVINIYYLFGKDKLTLFDLLILSHEIGHMVMGTTEDGVLNETWATYIEYEFLNEYYKKQGKKFPKAMFNQVVASIYKDNNIWEIIKRLHGKYGAKKIGKVLQDISQESFSCNIKLPLAYLKESILKHLSDVSFWGEYDKIQKSYYVPDLKIKLQELGEIKKREVKQKGYEGNVEVLWSWGGGPFYPLLRHDIILRINGSDVKNILDFKQKIEEIKSNGDFKSHSLEILREMTPFTITLDSGPLFWDGAKEFFNNKRASLPEKITDEYFTLIYKDVPSLYLKEFAQFIKDIYESLEKIYGIQMPGGITYIFEGLPNETIDVFRHTIDEDQNIYKVPEVPKNRISGYYFSFSTSYMKTFEEALNSSDKHALYFYSFLFMSICDQALKNRLLGGDYGLGFYKYVFSHGLFPKLRTRFLEKIDDEDAIEKSIFLFLENGTMNKKSDAMKAILEHVTNKYGNENIGKVYNISENESKTLSCHLSLTYHDARGLFEREVKDSSLKTLFNEYEKL